MDEMASSSAAGAELPKLILKNTQEKSTSSIKITKSQSGKSTSEIQLIDTQPAPLLPQVRKERKRKRTDSLENKGNVIMFGELFSVFLSNISF